MSERIKIALERKLNYQIKNPLIAAGYNYVDELMSIPLDALGAMLPGKTSLRRLAFALGRQDEFLAQYGPEEIEVDGEVVPMKSLHTIVNLMGTASNLRFDSIADLKKALKLGKRTDPDSGKDVTFGWIDVARFKLRRDKQREAQKVGEAYDIPLDEADGSSAVRASDAELDKLIEDRRASYARDYDTSLWTQSDASTLGWLASLEVRVEMLQRAQVRGMGGGSDMAVKMRSDEIQAALNQIRKIRDDLQISLRARIEAGQRQATEDVIKDLALRGKTLLAQRASILQHCGILQGIFLPNFPAHVDTTSITVRCARCGQPLQWLLITKEMLELYTEAGSFVPEDAPQGMFDDKGKHVKAVKA